jgi:DNA-binding protein HU-beta
MENAALRGGIFFAKSPKTGMLALPKRLRSATVPHRAHGVVTTEESGGFSMNKNELVSAVADKADLSKQQAGTAVDAIFEIIQDAMSKGDDIRLVGFGTFSVSHRAASKGRNPSTGAEVDIPARNVPKFAAGKGLKDAVNNK